MNLLNPNKLGEMIKIGRRGSLTGKLTIFGLQGHVAYPQRANNPSTIIIKILKELKDIKFDKGTRDFQPTNLEVTKINIIIQQTMLFLHQLKQHLIYDLIINIPHSQLKKT